MGSLWRSEDMILLQLLLQKEAVHDTVSRLGELSFVEFRDVSSWKIKKKVIITFTCFFKKVCTSNQRIRCS
jgi:hypothetical protein